MRDKKERKVKMLKYDEYVMNRNKNATDLFKYEDVDEDLIKKDPAEAGSFCDDVSS